MEFADVLNNQPVVIDNGSGMIKSGFAGAEQPASFFHSCVGRTKHTRVMAGAVEGEKFVGKRVQELRGLLKIKYPMEHGVVTNWDDMETIWHHVYNDELKTLSEEHPLLLTEAPLNPRQNRDMAAQILFESFNVPALFCSIQAVLSLYASGRTSGLVLDVGDGVSHAVPVYEGFAVANAIQRMDLAGRDVTDLMQLLLRRSGCCMYTSAEKEIVRLIKEKMCYLSLTPNKEDYLASGKPETFMLPDGKVIKVGSERFQAPEILFRPEIVGCEWQGVHGIVVDSINKVDMDLRQSLYSNIVLSGGTTLMKGFGEKLLYEIKHRTVQETKIKIFAPPERKYSTWIGGSILASLSTFKKMWVSAEEYQEDPDIVNRKMF